MSNNKKDVIAIGNAMVDVFIKSNLKTVNNYGVRTYNSPSTNSIGVKTSGSCTFNTDCSIGFKCDRKYKECVKR